MATDTPFIGDGNATTAASDLSTKQFSLVKLTTTPHTCDIASANADIIYGVLMNKPKALEVAEVGIFGIVKVLCGAAVTAGDLLMSDTSGRVILQVTTSPILGISLETSTAANQIISIFLRPSNKAV